MTPDQNQPNLTPNEPVVSGGESGQIPSGLPVNNHNPVVITPTINAAVPSPADPQITAAMPSPEATVAAQEQPAAFASPANLSHGVSLSPVPAEPAEPAAVAAPYEPAPAGIIPAYPPEPADLFPPQYSQPEQSFVATNEPAVPANVGPTVEPAVSQHPEPASPAAVTAPVFDPALVRPAAPVVSTAYNPTQPYNGSGAVVAATVETAKPAGRSKKKLWLLGGGVVASLLLISGGVFGLYMPNTPGSVWNTGLNRTGKALDGVVSAATTPKQLASYGTSVISGSVAAHVDGGSYNGSFTTSFDKSNLTGGLKFNLKSSDGSNQALSANVLSKLPTGSDYPNIYFQINGLKALGLDSFEPGISDYDGKWIVASSDYLKTLGDSVVAKGDNTKTQVTASDIAEVARTASSVTHNYLFTTDKDKAVFVKKSFVGKEQVDSISAYHYKVGLDTDHAEAYCVALTNAELSTKAYPKISGESSSEIADQKKSAAKDCQSSVKDAVKSSDTFDMWIDGHYKLIYKIRVYDPSDKGTYTDVGQLYKGGDQLSLFVKYHQSSSKTDGSFTLDTNLKTNSTKGVLKVASTDSDSPYDITVTLQADESTKPVTVTVPANPVSLQDVLKQLGFGSTDAGSSTGITGKADDNERQTDIVSLQAELEASYADNNGYYPTLAQLNSTAWRSENMPDAEAAIFTPPGSSATTLAAKATTSSYGYVPTDCTDDGCNDYTLTALLSDGTEYTQTSVEQ